MNGDGTHPGTWWHDVANDIRSTTMLMCKWVGDLFVNYDTKKNQDRFMFDDIMTTWLVEHSVTRAD